MTIQAGVHERGEIVLTDCFIRTKEDDCECCSNDIPRGCKLAEVGPANTECGCVLPIWSCIPLHNVVLADCLDLKPEGIAMLGQLSVGFGHRLGQRSKERLGSTLDLFSAVNVVDDPCRPRSSDDQITPLPLALFWEFFWLPGVWNLPKHAVENVVEALGENGVQVNLVKRIKPVDSLFAFQLGFCPGQAGCKHVRDIGGHVLHNGMVSDLTDRFRLQNLAGVVILPTLIPHSAEGSDCVSEYQWKKSHRSTPYGCN